MMFFCQLDRPLMHAHTFLRSFEGKIKKKFAFHLGNKLVYKTT